MTALSATRFEALRHRVMQAPKVACAGRDQIILFLSASDGTTRAKVVTVIADSAATAWQRAVDALAPHMRATRWVRADWVLAVDETTWGKLHERLGKTKRNYFRLGISLDAGFEHAFLESELNANAMLYGGRGQAHACFNPRNFSSYSRRRHGRMLETPANDDPVWTFATAAAFVSDDGVVWDLEPSGRDVGRRQIAVFGPENVRQLIADGSNYLADQVDADGRFTYGWHPCFDRPIPAYNRLRHASTLFAMAEALSVTADAALRAALERGVHLLTRDFIRPVQLPDGTMAAFLVDEGEEIKLGGNAVAILALAKYSDVTGDQSHRALMAQLGHGIVHMQQPDSGKFVHILHYPGLEVLQEFRIIYYDGEAAYALLRLYEMTGDGRWLQAAEAAFGYFVAAGHASAHDHWLAYAVELLCRYRPDPRWFKFGVDNFRDHLDFVAHRVTTFPTLLELMTASERLIVQLAANSRFSHLLNGVDLASFYQAMDLRARALLNGHFWPELAMFFANPDRVVGSFFIRHHGFRVRIDDVEHYLSGLVAYLAQMSTPRTLLDAAPEEQARRWTAANLARATGGEWVRQPPSDWSATGVAIVPHSLRAGDMAVVRGSDTVLGIAPSALPRLRPIPKAIIAHELALVAHMSPPMLRVTDTAQAVFGMARHARAQFSGKVIGVTGSAGKTTMAAMLAHALRAYGSVEESRLNANLPLGIAWNLASMDWDADHVVMELAIGRMRENTLLVRPDIAVFTNILPAHLEYHHDLATVAERKAAIFHGMAPGGTAILNREMEQWHRVSAAALGAGLRVVSYGQSEEADFSLRNYDAASGLVTAEHLGRSIRYHVAAPGLHMALNSLGALAALDALGLECDVSFADFHPLEGRGARYQLAIETGRITLIDDAYNANPGSMAAALQLLGETPARRRVAVLGEMLELGPRARDLHSHIADLIAASGIDQVHAAGALYGGMWDRLSRASKGVYAEDVTQLAPQLLAHLRDGDVVLVKGSHGSNMHRIAAGLRAVSEARLRAIQHAPPGQMRGAA